MKNTGMPEPFDKGCYLIHFEGKIGNRAEHYTGSADCIFERIDDHENTICTPPEPGEKTWHKKGPGAHLMGVVNYLQIRWKLARVWVGKGRDFECELKDYKNARRLCPECSGDIAYRRMQG